jgi:hypothetical protein
MFVSNEYCVENSLTSTKQKSGIILLIHCTIFTFIHIKMKHSDISELNQAIQILDQIKTCSTVPDILKGLLPSLSCTLV